MPSPTPSTKKLLTWGEACNALCDGKKVTRAEWGFESIYLSLVKEILCVYTVQDDKFHPVTISLGDMVGKDYYILE